MLNSASLVLAIDVGTSSTRTALFESRGTRLLETTAQESYPLLTGADGRAELDPAVVLEAVQSCIRQTIEHYRADAELRNRSIEAIGLSCFWHSMIGLNDEDVPLTPIITWADARPTEAAARLRAELSEKSVHARTGCMLRASFWPAKLSWFLAEKPKLAAKVSRWVSPAEWLQLHLVGEAQCSYSMASGTGFLHASKLRWDAPLLRKIGISAGQLLPIGDEPAPVAGRLAEAFPELRGAVWYPGIGDGAASNLGSGATHDGLAAVNVGTSAALRILRSSGIPRAPFGLFCYRLDAERFLIGGAASNAGNLRAWCLRELRLEGDGTAVETALAARSSPEHGLCVLPFWTAERAPTWNEELRGTIVGLTQHTTALDIMQAVTEASYHRIASIGELLSREETRPAKILVSGGIQHSSAAMQRLADVLGRTIYANLEPEASLRGAAVVALEKAGAKLQPLKLGKPIRPRAKIAEIYAKARRRQEALEQFFVTDSHHW